MGKPTSDHEVDNVVLEDKVRELGLDSISLHVFGHNHAAIALYQAAGYETTDLHMVKKLGG